MSMHSTGAAGPGSAGAMDAGSRWAEAAPMFAPGDVSSSSHESLASRITSPTDSCCDNGRRFSSLDVYGDSNIVFYVWSTR